MITPVTSRAHTHTHTKSSLAVQQGDFELAVQVNFRKRTLPMTKTQCLGSLLASQPSLSKAIKARHDKLKKSNFPPLT